MLDFKFEERNCVVKHFWMGTNVWKERRAFNQYDLLDQKIKFSILFRDVVMGLGIATRTP
jgi:hypothetical protein